MTTPPASAASPTPSSGSSHQQQQQRPQTFSAIAAYNPSSSGSSSGANKSTPSKQADDDSSNERYQESQNNSQQASGQNSGFQSSAAFLPQVTASPPPHPVPYVPPPQHAMAPDPIHSLSPTGGQPSVWGAGWRPAQPPSGPNGAAYPYPQGYGNRGGPPPNGHLTHQLPPNPMEAYGSSSRPSVSSTPGVVPLPPGSNGGTRSASQPGEPRDRRRERHRDDDSRDREDEEVISTIFVVGFPDDMSVSNQPCVRLTRFRSANFKTYSPLHLDSRQRRSNSLLGRRVVSRLQRLLYLPSFNILLPAKDSS